MVFFENHAENHAGRIIPDLVLFSFKIHEKQVVNTLVLIYFALDIQSKQTLQHLRLFFQIYVQF